MLRKLTGKILITVFLANQMPVSYARILPLPVSGEPRGGFRSADALKSDIERANAKTNKNTTPSNLATPNPSKDTTPDKNYLPQTNLSSGDAVTFEYLTVSGIPRFLRASCRGRQITFDAAANPRVIKIPAGKFGESTYYFDENNELKTCKTSDGRVYEYIRHEDGTSTMKLISAHPDTITIKEETFDRAGFTTKRTYTDGYTEFYKKGQIKYVQFPSGARYTYARNTSGVITLSWDKKSAPPDITKYVFGKNFVLRQIHSRDGTVEYYSPKGVILKIRKPDNTTLEFRPDGRISRILDKNGRVITVYEYTEEGEYMRAVMPLARKKITDDLCLYPSWIRQTIVDTRVTRVRFLEGACTITNVYYQVLGRYPTQAELESFRTAVFQREIIAGELKTRLENCSEYKKLKAQKTKIQNILIGAIGKYLASGDKKLDWLKRHLNLDQLPIPTITPTNEQITAIKTYLQNTCGMHFGSSAFKTLIELAKRNRIQINYEDLAAKSILLEILSGNITERTKGPLKISQYTLLELAQGYGLNLHARDFTYKNLQSACNLTKGVLTQIAGHYVLIIKADKNVTFYDPDIGETGRLQTISRADFLKMWNGYVLTDTPDLGVRITPAEANFLRGAGPVPFLAPGSASIPLHIENPNHIIIHGALEQTPQTIELPRVEQPANWTLQDVTITGDSASGLRILAPGLLGAVIMLVGLILELFNNTKKESTYESTKTQLEQDMIRDIGEYARAISRNPGIGALKSRIHAARITEVQMHLPLAAVPASNLSRTEQTLTREARKFYARIKPALNGTNWRRRDSVSDGADLPAILNLLECCDFKLTPEKNSCEIAFDDEGKLIAGVLTHTPSKTTLAYSESALAKYTPGNWEIASATPTASSPPEHPVTARADSTEPKNTTPALYGVLNGIGNINIEYKPPDYAERFKNQLIRLGVKNTFIILLALFEHTVINIYIAILESISYLKKHSGFSDFSIFIGPLSVISHPDCLKKLLNITAVSEDALRWLAESIINHLLLAFEIYTKYQKTILNDAFSAHKIMAAYSGSLSPLLTALEFFDMNVRAVVSYGGPLIYTANVAGAFENIVNWLKRTRDKCPKGSKEYLRLSELSELITQVDPQERGLRYIKNRYLQRWINIYGSEDTVPFVGPKIIRDCWGKNIAYNIKILGADHFDFTVNPERGEFNKKVAFFNAFMTKIADKREELEKFLKKNAKVHVVDAESGLSEYVIDVNKVNYAGFI